MMTKTRKHLSRLIDTACGKMIPFETHVPPRRADRSLTTNTPASRGYCHLRFALRWCVDFDFNCKSNHLECSLVGEDQRDQRITARRLSIISFVEVSHQVDNVGRQRPREFIRLSRQGLKDGTKHMLVGSGRRLMHASIRVSYT